MERRGIEPRPLPLLPPCIRRVLWCGQTAYRFYEHPNTYDGVDLDVERDQCVRQFDTEQLVTPRIPGRPREDGEFLELDVTVAPDQDAPECEPFIEVFTGGSEGAASMQRISASVLGDANVLRVGIAIGSGNLESPVKLRVEKSQIGQQGTLRATGFFRGRQGMSVIPVPYIPSGEEYVISRQNFPPPTVRVSGAPAKKVAIMFVMDCSGSMKDRTRDGARLAVAKHALESILGTLLETRDAKADCRIGVLAFSHRVGFRDKNSREGDYIRSAAYKQWCEEHPAEKPKTPDDDLEMVVGLDDATNPLSEELKKKVIDNFRKWEPLGETPLYYSMNQALEAFRDIPSDTTKHLIVITDGNDQISLVPEWLKEFRQKKGKDASYGPEQVGENLRSNYRDVEVSVLGIDMDYFTGRDVMSSTAGRAIHFDRVKDKRELIERIENALGLGRYTVQDQEKRSPAVEQKIPRKCQLKQWNTPAVYEVSMPAWKPIPKPARLFIEGGEAFELVLDMEQGGIVHRRYDPQKLLTKRADTADAFVSALYPKRESDRVTFPVTLQNLNEKVFSPRPVGIWATITPVRTEGGDDVGPAYHFFDRQFEAHTPVPVLDFTINDWPAEANWARLELWYRVAKELDLAFEDIPANAEKDLVNTANLDEFQVDGIAGITFSVRGESLETGNGVRVIVDERYDNGTKDVHQTRIMAKPPANHTIRSYNREGSFARHVFEYYGALNQPSKLLITSRERIQQAYSPLQKPLLVKLPPRHAGQ